MKTLHKSALTRAYRTLAQGLGSGAILTLIISIFSGDINPQAILSTVGTVLGAAFISFWQGVSFGLPEEDNLQSKTQGDGETDTLRKVGRYALLEHQEDIEELKLEEYAPEVKEFKRDDAP